MKIAKRILAIVVVFGLTIAILKALPYWITDDTESYTRLMMHEFYEKDDIDVLVVGASHSYMSVNPEVITQRLNQTAFCAGSANQFPDISLAMVKESFACHKIGHVYLEVSASVAAETGVLRDRTYVMQRVFLITDYLRPSMNKYELLLKSTSPDNFLNTFLLPHKGIEVLFNPKALMELHEKKTSDIYKNYAYDYAVHEEQGYAGDGFVADNRTVPPFGFFDDEGFTPFDLSLVSEDWKKNVAEIIDLCKSEGVPITLFIAPISNFLLAGWENYDEYYEFVKEFAESKGVEFVDFNLLDSAYFKNSGDFFYNRDHLNKYGAEVFSNVFSDYIAGELPEDAFWSSTAERLNAEEPEFYGVAYLNDENVERKRQLRLISNHPEAFEFQITYAPKKGEPELIQEYSGNTDLTLSFEWGGKLLVDYKRVGAPDDTATEVEFVF